MIDINLFELLSTIDSNKVIRTVDTTTGDIMEGCTDFMFSTIDYETLGRNVKTIKASKDCKMIIEF